MENLGPVMHDYILGLAVPAYVTIDSIAELNGHRREFRGRIVGVDPGSGIMGLAEQTVKDYDLGLDLGGWFRRGDDRGVGSSSMGT